MDPILGAAYDSHLRVIAKRRLRQFWERPQYADAKGPLEAWHAEAMVTSWKAPQEIKAQCGSSSGLKGGRVVCNIGGNKYRLVVAVDYGRQACFVKFIGTRKQYDAIEAEKIQ